VDSEIAYEAATPDELLMFVRFSRLISIHLSISRVKAVEPQIDNYIPEMVYDHLRPCQHITALLLVGKEAVQGPGEAL
jgi:hypothetical protein